ncbi:[protein-PII] uridylyltransferase family protein [Bdellovibrio svalbardensis]|uniref:Glutamine-synthetase adenylyltransferase n=1 Tax=Bdellovibrio svalbardensis TaxID=2972972 RepID=A0ABT6DD51_9BACT|nr:glutamine-synthetase adenylyltransferase [Bdellovibrio svalbardensis]MDG0814785.1 glutamine-synthetase adenylyltransferase [Bdellovibrio svalbardensis]
MSNLSFDEQLRRERNEIWSRCALAAKENSEDPQQICLHWSHSADSLLAKAFQACFSSEKIALFALGKLGSSELNLSSDVDLVLVTEEESASALSALRKFQKILGDRTSHGFVFRLDFDLRPGGKQGPLIPTLEQFRDYYGNYGETWERLAFVRLRPLAGDPTIIDAVMTFAKKFSFRRHLDFTLLEDLKTLRTKIQGHYWGRTQNNTVDLKLGVGGIRDVELFTHALQVVHGGKDPSLQIKGTQQALQLLAERKLLPEEEAFFLQRHYWNLRRLENYVQALEDQQTHLLKTDENHPDFVIKALASLSFEMKRCDQIVKSLLGEAPKEISVEEELSKIGLPQEELQDLWNEILGQEVLSRHRGRDEIARKAFLQEFLQTLKEQGGDIHRALLLLKDFIQGTRAKATFFSLLLREKDLMKKLAWLFGHSPYLSRILCNRPELLDSFVYRSQDKPSEDMGLLLEELAEKRLLSELISGSQFLEDKDLTPLLTNLTSTADSIAETLLPAIKKEYPSSLRILALGKWGGAELGFRSDLDFIFVIPDQATDNDFKVAKRFINRLTESHRGGNIFSIDMRLRPSGKAGPIVMPLADLQDYLHQEAQAWERQVYLKARWIGESDSNFLPAVALEYLDKGLSAEELIELNRIRLELISKSSLMNLKYSEGGLVDIELAAQAYVLEKKLDSQSTQTFDFISLMGPLAADLQKNYGRMRQIEQMLQLVASESSSELNPNHESFQALALALHTSPAKLLEEVRELLTANIAILKELDPRRKPQ